jgi:hypothetical protein
MGLCDVIDPEIVELAPGHRSKCHLTVEQLSEEPTLVQHATLVEAEIIAD